MKSQNLLSYGPVTANGLTFTVTSDGRLHAEGVASTAHKGAEWDQPIIGAIRGNPVTFSVTTAPSGCYAYVHIVGDGGADLGNITSGQTVLIPETATHLKLRVAPNAASAIDGYLQAQLELGDSATAWVRPDDTNHPGGGL